MMRILGYAVLGALGGPLFIVGVAYAYTYASVTVAAGAFIAGGLALWLVVEMVKQGVDQRATRPRADSSREALRTFDAHRLADIDAAPKASPLPPRGTARVIDPLPSGGPYYTKTNRGERRVSGPL